MWLIEITLATLITVALNRYSPILNSVVIILLIRYVKNKYWTNWCISYQFVQYFFYSPNHVLLSIVRTAESTSCYFWDTILYNYWYQVQTHSSRSTRQKTLKSWTVNFRVKESCVTKFTRKWVSLPRGAYLLDRFGRLKLFQVVLWYILRLNGSWWILLTDLTGFKFAKAYCVIIFTIISVSNQIVSLLSISILKYQFLCF